MVNGWLVVSGEWMINDEWMVNGDVGKTPRKIRDILMILMGII